MGMGFGILLSAKTDYGSLWALFISAFTLSAAIQYAEVDILRSVQTIPQIILLTVLVNLRYVMYGLSMIERFRHLGFWRKLYMIHTLTDETYALEVENRCPPGGNSDTYCFEIALFDHIYWIFGCVAGSVLGNFIHFNTRGIEFAMTALFIVILTDQCLAKENRMPALIGLAVTIVCRMIFGPANMLVAAIFLNIFGVILCRKWLNPDYQKNKNNNKPDSDNSSGKDALNV